MLIWIPARRGGTLRGNFGRPPPALRRPPHNYVLPSRVSGRSPPRKESPMSAAVVRRTGLACLSLVAVVFLIVLARVTASAPPPPAVFEACINPGNGGMRLVDASTACHNNETRVSWNNEG